MKIAVVIDYKKINQIKQKIETQNYIDNAISHLAFQLTLLFI